MVPVTKLGKQYSFDPKNIFILAMKHDSESIVDAFTKIQAKKVPRKWQGQLYASMSWKNKQLRVTVQGNYKKEISCKSLYGIKSSWAVNILPLQGSDNFGIEKVALFY